ncbi:hypothetical protein J2S00_003814 [Caldalkalibacillus uzonensis]|uniref:Uncharacterized protein n=1 Tax=Caldalkalibacillus uzonensis TaxID=353224 RepID=A0ABU0CXW5_9BACI|nr:hypothetical protein [Caldalkalibacillus uzonensis]
MSNNYSLWLGEDYAQLVFGPPTLKHQFVYGAICGGAFV